MNTRWFVFSMLVFISSFAASAQYIPYVETNDIFLLEDFDKHELRVHKYRSSWEKLIPTTYTMQYAGSMGVVSIGPGWCYGRKNQWETKIMFGFLPRFSGHRANITFSIKENYIPWTITLGKKDFSFEPLTCGVYMTTILNGEDFWIKQSSRYPDGYYWFSSRIRTNICLGHSFTYHIPNSKRLLRNSVTFFYEVSTNDFYLITFATNKTIGLKDVFHLSFGIRSLLF